MMSVIIRLQNLPWSANALDIRKFFVGLCIPDGGVHIVGGEMGDAFIAFSTDEDARRSMMLDRGQINQTQIRLYLSSRAEMQTVIETARENSLKKQLKANLSETVKNSKNTVLQPPLLTSSSLQNILSKNTSSITNIAERPNLEYSGIRKDRKRDRSRLSRRDSRSTSSERHRSRSKERSSTTYRRHSRDNNNKAHRSSRRSTSRDRGRERDRERSRNRGRSRSRDLNSSDHSQRGSSRESANRKNDNQDKELSRTHKLDNRMTDANNRKFLSNHGFKSYDLTVESDMEKPSCDDFNQFSKENSIQNYAINTNATQSLPFPPHNELNPQNKYSNTNNYVTTIDMNSDLNVNNEDKSRNMNNSINSSNFQSLNLLSSLINQPRAMENKPSNAFQNPYNISRNVGQPNVPAVNWEMKNPITAPNFPNQSPINNTNNDIQNSASIKILNMIPTTVYNDIRRFFTGIIIPQKGIKILNNQHGNRIGIAYVNFTRTDYASRALLFNNNYLKTQRVTLVRVSDKEFNDAIDSYRPMFKNTSMQEPCDTINVPPPKIQLPFQSEENRFMFNPRNQPSVVDGSNQITNELPLTVLRLEDLPPFAREQDIIKMFGSYTILDIIVTRTTDKEYVAFVKFHRSDDAKTALNDRSNHLIGHRQICAKPSSEIELEQAREEKNKSIQKEMIDDEVKEKAKKIEIQMEMEIERSRFLIKQTNDTDINVDIDNKQMSSSLSTNNNDNDDNKQNDMSNLKLISLLEKFGREPLNGQQLNSSTNESNTSYQSENSTGTNQNSLNSNNSSSIPSLLSLNSSSVSMSNETRIPPINMPGYILARNLDFKVINRDIGEYFVSENLCPLRIEILLNNRGVSSGDAIIEFASVENAKLALKLNSRIFSGRKMHIEIVTREAINQRLGVNFLRPESSLINIMNNDAFANNKNVMNPPLPIPMNMNLAALGNRSNFPAMNLQNVPQQQQQQNIGNLNQNRFSEGGNANDNFGRFNRQSQPFNTKNRSNQSFDNDHSTSSKSIPEEFTKRGSILVLENVPYKASINEIIEFFGEFKLTGSDIIRRYNDNGTPTGDARVDFKTPELAQSALNSRKGKKMYNRTIFLKLL